MSRETRNIRPEKQSMVEEIRGAVDDSAFVFMADFTGMDMGRTSELRRRLRNVGGRYRVVRNRLLRHAASDPALAAAAGELAGATAVVTGEGDVVDIAKTLKDFIKEHDRPVMKGGVFEGERLAAADIQALGELPPKPVLQSMLLGVLSAPMRDLAGVFQQKLSSLVYVLKAVEEKKQGASEAPAEA